MTFAIVLGILTYLGVPAVLAPYPVAAGLLMLGSGLALARWRSPGRHPGA
jgi:hypothetical protein